MAGDRWRDDQERSRTRAGQAYGRGTDYRGDGTIAQRGFGNDRSGYDPNRGDNRHSGHRAEGDFTRGRTEERSEGGYSRDSAPSGFDDSFGRGSIDDRYEGGGAYGSDYRGSGTAGGRSRRESAGGGYGAESYDQSYRDYNTGTRRSGGPAERAHGPEDYETPGYGDWGMPARRHRAEHADRSSDDRRSGDDRGFWQTAADEVSSWFGGDEDRPNHRGRGPKGYVRSDERIREEVCERLTHDPYVDASDIEIAVSNREVTLSGLVDSREAKRRAEDCAEHVSGVSHVQNNLRVRQPGMNTGTGGASGASGGGLSSGTGSDVGGATPGSGGTRSR
jgi:hypothetical protein